MNGKKLQAFSEKWPKMEKSAKIPNSFKICANNFGFIEILLLGVSMSNLSTFGPPQTAQIMRVGRSILIKFRPEKGLFSLRVCHDISKTTLNFDMRSKPDDSV